MPGWHLIGISLKAPVSVPKRLLFLMMNMTYCFGLIYYFHVPFRRVRPLPDDF